MLTTCLKLKLLLKTSSQLYVKLVYVVETKLQVSIKFVLSILLVSRKRKLLVAKIRVVCERNWSLSVVETCSFSCLNLSLK